LFSFAHGLAVFLAFDWPGRQLRRSSSKISNGVYTIIEYMASQ
jgi:hypothetical protein